jgi:hypothetical protein
MPLAPSLFWSRALAIGEGADVAAELRRRFAPGRLGRDPGALAAAAAGALLLGSWIAARGRPSHGCQRCGRRVCARCETRHGSGKLCDGCHKLFFEPEKTDRVLRAQRVNELREREVRLVQVQTAISLVVPGAASLFADRPVRAWLAATSFALLVAALVWSGGVVPDPWVAGAAGPAAFLGVAALSAIAYALTLWTSLAARRREL